MAKRVKTSLFLDPGLFREAKIKALRDSETLSDALESALRAWLGESPSSPLDGLTASQRAIVLRVIELARKGAAERIDIIRRVAHLPLPGEIDGKT